MSVINRLHGYSVQCDNCEEGGFCATSKLSTALDQFGLKEVNDRHLCEKCEALNGPQ